MTVERLVLDCNVLISAALVETGTAARALDAAYADHVLLLSQPTFDEFATRLGRPKFHRYLGEDARKVLLKTLTAVAEWVEIEGLPMGCRDLDDDKYLETALRGEADAIVTGDGDLLVMNPFEGIQIMTPAASLARRTDA
ncbi:MAG TPA: putative toxin-antitoxin system toxin component, PIN family [Sphingomonadaceae bacterium]|nr:putative toxin-antitoxin system toxin component, PIN family [Sphingomonadaceae bacterium]